MKWFSRPKYTTLNPSREKRDLPPGVWTKCENCQEYLTQREIETSLQVCPRCGFYFRLSAPKRLEMLVDPGTFVEHDESLESCDPLGFAGYAKKIVASQEKTGLMDAILSGVARIDGTLAVVVITDFAFIGGSMGSVVGERVTRAMEYAVAHRLPLVSATAGGGGARMQEGTLSLMQMAKTSAAVARMRKAGIPFISILTDPTMGGVAASYAALGDVLLAEPGALIGFTGPRVIEQTIGQRLPEGFQRSEFLLAKGMIDLIVQRSELKATVARLLRYLSGNLARLPERAADSETDDMVAEKLQLVGSKRLDSRTAFL